MTHPRVRERLAPLIEAGLVATCAPRDFESPYSARTPADYESVRGDRALAYEYLPTDDVDWQRARGCSANWQPVRCCDLRLMVLARTDRPGRQRFTLAHELGHILFGDSGSDVIEEQLFSFKSHEESRADAFAASFLMPRSEVEEALDSRDVGEAFRDLTWSFRVSPDSMAWRLKNLGLISDTQRRAIPVEPLSRVAVAVGRMDDHRRRIEESTLCRAPGRLADPYIGAYLHGHIGAAPVSDISGLPVETIERLLDDVDNPDRWPDIASGE